VNRRNVYLFLAFSELSPYSQLRPMGPGERAAPRPDLRELFANRIGAFLDWMSGFLRGARGFVRTEGRRLGTAALVADPGTLTWAFLRAAALSVFARRRAGGTAARLKFESILPAVFCPVTKTRRPDWVGHRHFLSCWLVYSLFSGPSCRPSCPFSSFGFLLGLGG